MKDTEGFDLFSNDKSLDVHVRLEGGRVLIDLFDSSIKDNNQAHIESEDFDNWVEAKKWLECNGFNPKGKWLTKEQRQEKHREVFHLWRKEGQRLHLRVSHAQSMDPYKGKRLSTEELANLHAIFHSQETPK
jgi:hypothetical protein